MFNQRRSGSYRYQRAILLLAAFALLVPPIGHAANKWYDVTLDVPRPADSYAIHFETDHSVCGPITASLNKEYRIDPNKLDDIPRVSLPTDSHLSADIQIPWTRKFVEQPDGVNFKITSLDVAQITSADLVQRWNFVTVFRRTVEKSFPGVGALSINRIWISGGILPSSISDHTLTAHDVDRRRNGAEILVDITNQRDILEGKNLAVLQNLTEPLPLLLNVVSVKGRLFLLVVDAVQAEFSAPRAPEGTVDLFVLEILSEVNIRAVCWLTGT
jgi:hypothetical protein